VETGDPAKIQTSLGTILASGGQEIEAGTDVTCCLRPERISIVSTEGPTGNEDGSLLPAKIVSNIYLGEIRQYICSLGENGGILWRVSVLADSSGEMKKGERVQLRVPARDVALLRS